MSTPDANRAHEAAERRRARARSSCGGFVQGDLGSLRVLIGLVAHLDRSSSPRTTASSRRSNLTNLVLQITAIGLISVGVVLVLLLGEIDLSVGAVSGLCAAIMAVLNVKHGWDPYLAIAAARRGGRGDRARSRARCSRRFGDPVVRRHAGRPAGLAGRAAVGARRHRHDQHHRPARSPAWPTRSTRDAVGWIIAAVVIAASTPAVALAAAGGGWRPGLAGQAARGRWWSGSCVVAAAVVATVAVLNSDRGVPLAVADPASAFVVGVRVRRHAHRASAATSSRSAATPRRRGAPASASTRIRIASSRSPARWRRSAASWPPRGCWPSTRPPAAATCCCWRSPARSIAGTSLFGGRGSVWTALLGALVIGSISNGMDLLALASAVKFMVTGGVLLLAVIVDALARQQRQAAGRV